MRLVAIKRGICRTVMLVGPWAVKVPSTRPFGRRKDRLWAWTRGYQANHSELAWRDIAGVAPVLHSWLGGMVQIYPRCAEPDPGEWNERTPREAYRTISPAHCFGDCKPQNIGLLNDRVVWLDYDASWNSCLHDPQGGTARAELARAWDEGRQWLAEQGGDVSTDGDPNPYCGP